MEEQQFGSWIRATQSGPSKKSVVRVSSFYEDRAENLSTRRRSEMKFSPAVEPIQKSNSVFQTNKETTDMEADCAKTHNTNSHKHMSANVILIPVVQDRGNKGGDFAQQLKEIDKELRIYKEPQNSRYTENAVLSKENSQSFNMEKLRIELAPNQNLVKTPLRETPIHRSHAPPLQDVTNYSHAPMTVENPSQKKWKCVIHEFAGKAPIIEDLISSKCPINIVVDISESPCKKILVSNKDKKKLLDNGKG